MLRVEQVLDRGQADVLVHPAVAGDVVIVQQLVVVLACRRRIAGRACRCAGVSSAPVCELKGSAVCALSSMKVLPTGTAS